MGVLADLVTVIGLPLAVAALWVARRQERTQFEQSFVDRYWALEDAKLHCGDCEAPCTQHEARYLRLCEDQFEMMRLGYISWRTWLVWHSGIVASPGPLSEDRTQEFVWITQCRNDLLHTNGAACPGVLNAPPTSRRESGERRIRRWSPGLVVARLQVRLRGGHFRGSTSARSR